MILALPTPTFFPYTTLFRSHRRIRRLRIEHIAFDRRLQVIEPRLGRTGQLEHDLMRPRGDSGGQQPPSRNRRIPREDRKSTRLNSSHLGISYAVFCLKKKNK